MDVSVWWVVVASLVGMWAGFSLCAVMTIAREPPIDPVLERSEDPVA